MYKFLFYFLFHWKLTVCPPNTWLHLRFRCLSFHSKRKKMSWAWNVAYQRITHWLLFIARIYLCLLNYDFHTGFKFKNEEMLLVFFSLSPSCAVIRFEKSSPHWPIKRDSYWNGLDFRFPLNNNTNQIRSWNSLCIAWKQQRFYLVLFMPKVCKNCVDVRRQCFGLLVGFAW